MSKANFTRFAGDLLDRIAGYRHSAETKVPAAELEFQGLVVLSGPSRNDSDEYC